MDLFKLIQSSFLCDTRKCQSITPDTNILVAQWAQEAEKKKKEDEAKKAQQATEQERATLEGWNKARGGTGKIQQNKAGKYFLKNQYGVFFADGSGYAKDSSGKAFPYTKNLLDANGSFRDKKYLESFQQKQETPGGGGGGGITPKGPDKPRRPFRPAVHTATYTPGQNAEGVYAVKGWQTNQWGGGKKGVLSADIAKKLGLKEGATAQDAQNFLRSKGYGITSDNYWGKQSQAAFDDFVNRGSIKATSVETPQLQTESERHNYSTYNPETKQYTYNSNFEITPQQLRDAGVTNFRGYQNFMGNADNASNQYKGVYDFFNRVKEQNSGTNFGDEESFNKFFGTSGNFGLRDRNRIIRAGATSQAAYDRVSPQGTPITTRSDYGKQYDALNNALSEDDRRVGNITWVNSGDKQIPVYQASNGNYYKVGEDGKLAQTGTYSMGTDGKYSVSFRNGGSLNKFQQGGQINMDEQQLQQAFLQYLMQKTGAQDESQLEQVIQKLGENGLKQAYAQFMQEMQQQQVQAAKFGAKLNYIKKLNGQCPEGTEMYYYKQGGRLCKKCLQSKQQFNRNEPSNPIDSFKCGRKIKKNQKGGSFKDAFNAAYGKQRYFIWNGNIYSANKIKDRAKDTAFQNAQDNLEQVAAQVPEWGAKKHLGNWNSPNQIANFKHQDNSVVAELPEVTVIERKSLPEVIVTAKKPKDWSSALYGKNTQNFLGIPKIDLSQRIQNRF